MTSFMLNKESFFLLNIFTQCFCVNVYGVTVSARWTEVHNPLIRHDNSLLIDIFYIRYKVKPLFST